MASSRNLHRHTRVAALANVQTLAAHAALGRARKSEEAALASLASAAAAREGTLKFWQDRLEASILEPVLLGQFNRLLASNEETYAKAAKLSRDAQSKVLASQADLREAEGRHSALKRNLARARRKLRRKRDAATDAEHECGARRGDRI